MSSEIEPTGSEPQESGHGEAAHEVVSPGSTDEAHTTSAEAEPPAASAAADAQAKPKRSKSSRIVRWVLMSVGVLALLAVVIGAAAYFMQPSRNVQDTIESVMAAEFGPYSKDLSGWPFVADRETYVMHVVSQNQVEIDGKPKLLIGVIGYPVNDPAGANGLVQHRTLVADMTGSSNDGVKYFGMYGAIKVYHAFQEVKIDMIKPGKDMYGWQVEYKHGKNEGYEQIDREIYLIDTAKSEVIFAGTLPVLSDNTSQCEQRNVQRATAKAKVEEQKASDAAQEEASSVATAQADEEAQDEPDDEPMTCQRVVTEYKPITSNNAGVYPLEAKTEVTVDDKTTKISGRVVFDAHTMKLTLPDALSEAFYGNGD
ncbi:hypothetical protein [Andreprevotia chitinilytica]|uniref:hypothetical protein n=1 Tax=Andreprevotia chitinilytica TaxID=396808 RepID=UPI00055064E9|nr:hypothetical protein [Andreprevotia chitinilytica]